MGHVTRFSKPEETEEQIINHFEQVPENRTAVDNILRVNHGNQNEIGVNGRCKSKHYDHSYFYLSFLLRLQILTMRQ